MILTGQRVKLAPHLDLWMRGVRYADVILVGKKFIHLRDNQGRLHKLSIHHRESLEVLDENFAHT